MNDAEIHHQIRLLLHRWEQAQARLFAPSQWEMYERGIFEFAQRLLKGDMQ